MKENKSRQSAPNLYESKTRDQAHKQNCSNERDPKSAPDAPHTIDERHDHGTMIKVVNIRKNKPPLRLRE